MIFSAEKLYKNLDENYISVIKTVSQAADDFGVNAYIIGGVVRDLILDLPIYDIDFLIEGNAVEFAYFLEEKNLCKIKRLTDEFGTAKVEFTNNITTDIASTRIEKYPQAGHLPIVEKIGCSLKEDILRRDFTVNTLALYLNQKTFAKLIDFTNGLSDICTKQLRILHDKSFTDDPTRIIRALRFKYKLGFNTEEKTQQLQDAYLEQYNNNDICYERIKQVLKLAFNMNNANLFDEFIEKNIYKLITNIKPAPRGKVICESVLANQAKINTDNIWLVYLACLINSEEAEKLNLSAKETEIISKYQELILQKVVFKTNFDIYNFFKNSPLESIIAYIATTKSAQAQKFLTELKDIKIELDGKRLIQLGFQEGKEIGKTLETIFREKINGKIVSKQDEINYAKKLLS